MVFNKEINMADNVNKPEHYTYGKYECIDVVHELTKDLAGVQAFALGNTLKYLWRFTHKNGVEDLEKARWYLDKLIAEFKEPKENDCKPKEMDTEPKEEFHRLGFRINAEGRKELIDPVTNVFIPGPEQLNPFHESNYVYHEANEYLGDATNPNACVVTKSHGTGARAIYQLDADMNVVAKFSSIAKAMRKMKNRGIDKALKRGSKSGGYYWKYAD